MKIVIVIYKYQNTFNFYLLEKVNKVFKVLFTQFFSRAHHWILKENSLEYNENE